MTKLRLLQNLEERAAVAMAFLAFTISTSQCFNFFTHLVQYESSEYLSWVYLNREELISFIGASFCLILTWYSRRRKWLTIVNLIWISVSLFVLGMAFYFAFWFALTSIHSDPKQRQNELEHLRLVWERYWYLPIVFLLLAGVWVTQWRVLYTSKRKNAEAG